MGRLAENGRRWAFDRERLVRRAETLKGWKDGPFRRHLDEARRVWNETFPGFSLSPRTPSPTDRVATVSDILYPPKLAAAFGQEQDQSRRYKSLSSAERLRHHHNSWDTDRGMDWWNDMLADITSRAWPPDDFPHPLTGHRHPAALFVALCALFDVETVPASSIFEVEYGPEWAPVHPDNLEKHPRVLRLEAQIAALEQALRNAEEDERLGHGWARDRIAEADLAWHEVEGTGIHLEFMSETTGFWFVPIVPGLTADEWTAARPEALATAQHRYGDDPVDLRIRHHRDQGLSYQSIADRLGMPKSTVADHVRAYENR